MSRRTLVLVLACLICALALPLGAQTTGDSLKYIVPTPPEVSYQTSSTLSMTAPDGIKASVETSATLMATFEAGPAGVIVTASLAGLTVATSIPTGPFPTGPQTVEPLVTGEYLLVVDSRGGRGSMSCRTMSTPAGTWAGPVPACGWVCASRPSRIGSHEERRSHEHGGSIDRTHL